jgi:hypothetical protein
MQADTRTRRNGFRRGRTYLDPHYFTAAARRRPPQGLRTSRKAAVSRVSHPIRMEEVLEDLTYGRD